LYYLGVLAGTTITQRHVADAAIALANYYQFASGEQKSQPRVQSRMLLWCKAGRGTMHVNGAVCALAQNDFLFIPWQHAITYQADEKEPFFVGGIHVIPAHDRQHKLVYDVPHHEGAPLAECRWRRDVKLPGLEGLRRGSFTQQAGLRHLAEHIVRRFTTGPRHEWEWRGLAALLLTGIADAFRDSPRADASLPVELQAMVAFVRGHLHQPVMLDELARLADRSPSAVGRLFRQHLGVTPVTFINRAKMDRARQLLATSRQPVAEIGAQVGVADPYYFSKLFRKTVGRSPLEYRRTESLL